MIAEKNTSYSTASNVDLIRGSNSESVGREIGHEPSVRNGEAVHRFLQRDLVLASSQVQPGSAPCFPSAPAAVPHLLFISQSQLPGLHHGSLFYCSLVPLLSLWYVMRPAHYHVLLLTKPLFTSSYCHRFQCHNLQRSRMEFAHLTEC